VRLPWVKPLPKAPFCDIQTKATHWFVTQQDFDALMKQPYRRSLSAQNYSDGKCHSGIKLTDKLCLKTLPGNETPEKYLPHNPYWDQTLIHQYEAASSFTSFSMKLARQAKKVADRIMAIPHVRYPFTVKHYGAFHIKANHPWAKAGFVRPGVQLVMERAPGKPCEALGMMKPDAFLQHTDTIKQTTGIILPDRSPGNVFYDPTTQRITHIDLS
jgi:hypothetical protein